MYAWIWRHLPFGRYGKLASSAVLVGAAVALMWFVVFPWLDPFIEETLLPWNDSQLTGDWTPGEEGTAPVGPDGSPDPELVGPDGEPLDPHDLPYDTDQ